MKQTQKSNQMQKLRNLEEGKSKRRRRRMRERTERETEKERDYAIDKKGEMEETERIDSLKGTRCNKEDK